MGNNYCVVCEQEMQIGYTEWHFRCSTCKYESSNLRSTINKSPSLNYDEDDRLTGLKKLRYRNFERLYEVLKDIKPSGGRLLEVGCGHGWFMSIVKQHFKAVGIEPDIIYDHTDSGYEFRKGYYPYALESEETFEIIVFNDVLEHLDDLDAIIHTAYRYLNHDGVVLINIPISTGLFYKLSKILLGLGKSKYFERMWQKNLPSPHIHYFNKENLCRLFSKYKFQVIKSGALETILIKGLYQRISWAGNLSTLTRSVIYCILIDMIPLIKFLPSDIMYVVFKKSDDSFGDGPRT